jgi:hypothetical protein
MDFSQSSQLQGGEVKKIICVGIVYAGFYIDNTELINTIKRLSTPKQLRNKNQCLESGCKHDNY